MSTDTCFGLASLTETSSLYLTVAGTAVATVATLAVLRAVLWPVPPKLVRSPLRTTLPRLSKHEITGLPYGPSSFPGARDVETPYGSIRVYEWGPLTGEKVVLIHGISTPCMTLSKLAYSLVEEKGCRVLIFDLFGRGFSDNPSDLPHDARLYTTQILMALASSPHLSWVGPQAFKLVGYSLGGGIAVHFAAAFPHLISSLVLLAPAGLIRPESFGRLTRAIFTSGLVPPPLLERLASRKLRQPIQADGRRRVNSTGNAAPASAPTPTSHSQPVVHIIGRMNGHPNGNANSHANGNVKGHANGHLNGYVNGYANGKPNGIVNGAPNGHPVPYESGTPAVTLQQQVSRAVHWQLDHHPGFVPAFLSCIRHGPLLSEHAAWARLAAVRAPGTTAVILGSEDDLIDLDEYEQDALPLLGGKEHVRWRVIRGGGHDFPMSHAQETLRAMYEAWGWE
ncbi:hypothetical protein VTJ83DRAFT_270 [Remersonia thermophila]|uniref:AB hydrolase-1 domain-containing protein n=1 Tax=Remersonia thermophila TaxID=72144 RepID=A0ABR4DMZ8_9PEZI